MHRTILTPASLMVVLCTSSLSLSITSPQPCQAAQEFEETGDNFSRYNNHADPDAPTLRHSKPGEPYILTVGFAEDAEEFTQKLLNSLKQKKHVTSLKKEGRANVITDHTSKETFKILPNRQGKRTASSATPEFLAEIFPNNSTILFTLSSEYEKQRKWQKALELYQKAFKIQYGEQLASRNPSPSEQTIQGNYYANCAYFELNLQNRQAALTHLSQAIKLRPEQVANYRNRANLYMQLGQFDLAKADRQRVVELTRQNQARQSSPAAAIEEANEPLGQVNRGAYEQAVETCNKIIAHDPKYRKAYFARLLARVHMGDYKGAVEDGTKLAQLNNKNPRVLQMVKELKMLLKEGPPPYGDLAILDEPPPVLFTRLIGMKAYSIPMSKYAREHKGDARVYDALAVRYWKSGRLREADEMVNRMLHMDRSDLCVLRQKTQTAEALGNWKETRQACDLYLQEMGDNPEAFLNLDLLQSVYSTRKRANAELGNYRNAVDDCNILLKMEPDSAEVYRDRADYHMKLNNYAEAVKDYSQSIKFDDTRTSSNYLMRARAYDKLKQPALAAADRETAHKLDLQIKKSGR